MSDAFDTDRFRKSIDYIKEHGGKFRITNAIDALFLWDKICENYQIVFSSGFAVIFDDFMVGSNDSIMFYRWFEVDGKYYQSITCVLTIFQGSLYRIGNIEVEI